jgi:hypothetical protein
MPFVLRPCLEPWTSTPLNLSERLSLREREREKGERERGRERLECYYNDFPLEALSQTKDNYSTPKAWKAKIGQVLHSKALVHQSVNFWTQRLNSGYTY